MKKIFKNKYFWLAAVLIIAAVAIYNFNSYLKKKTRVATSLQMTSNVILNKISPSWASKLPPSVHSYLESMFPVNASYVEDENFFDVYSNDDQYEKIPFDKFCRLAGELGNIRKINISTQSLKSGKTTVAKIDPLFKNDLQSLIITCDRLKLVEVHHPKRLKELLIICTDLSDKTYETISNADNLKILRIHTGDFITLKNLEHLKSLTEVEELTLIGLNCDENDLTFLKKMNSLQKLTLKHSGLSLYDNRSISNLFQLDKALNYLSGSNLEEINATVVLSKANIKTLCSFNQIPNSFYSVNAQIDDEYLNLLDQLLSKLSNSQDSLEKAVLKKVSLSDMQKVTDASAYFFKKYPLPNLNFTKSKISSLSGFHLDKCQTFSVPAGIDINDLINQLKAPSYEIMDLRSVKISDKQLSQLLGQTRPRLLLISGEGLSKKAVEIVMQTFKKFPKEIVKVSFGNWDIPQSVKLDFLDRVNQWGMSVVYSSHLDKDLMIPEWQLHTKKTIYHEKKDALLIVDTLFPRLTTLTLTGNSASAAEWKSIMKIKNLKSLYLESKQSGKAVNDSGICRRLDYFDIKGEMSEPVQLSDNILQSVIQLNDNDLSEIISLNSGSPKNLLVQGTGSIDLAMFSKVDNLKELKIGSNISLKGDFPEMSGLQLLKCAEPLNVNALKSIKNLSNLKVLSVNTKHLSKQILTEWKSLKALTSLDLKRARLSDDDMTPLNTFISLTALRMPMSESITSQVLKTLEKLPSLKKVDFNGTAVYPEKLKINYSKPGSWDFNLD